MFIDFNFQDRIDSLCQNIEVLSYEWEPQLSDEARASLGAVTSCLFLEALKLLEEDKKLESFSSGFVDIITRRCHKFQQLANKFHSLDEKILKKLKESDSKIKSYGALRKINERISRLREQALMQCRLPIHYGNHLKAYEQKLCNELRLEKVDFQSLEEVEKETFHLLTSRLEDFKGLESKRLEGRSMPLALITHINLVKKTIENSSQRDSVLDALQRALKLAMKLDFAGKNHTNEQDLAIYFEKLSSVESLLFELERDEKTNQRDIAIDQASAASQIMIENEEEKREGFISDFSVGNSSLPRELFIHDISWDVVESIHALKNKEFVFIPLGTKRHLVIAKIECHINGEEMSYTYQLFNTGAGCREYHKIQSFNQKVYVKPLKITGIQLSGFNYNFLKEVFTCKLEEYNIHFLYELQNKYLIGLGGGRKVKGPADIFYPIQKFGTCTFAASEMALFSHLDIKDQEKMEVVKASYAFKKQLKVVKHRRILMFQCKNPIMRGKLLDKLRQSQVLLRKSREYLRLSLREWDEMNQRLKSA